MFLRLSLAQGLRFISSALLVAVSLGLPAHVSAGTRSIDLRDEQSFRLRGEEAVVGGAGDVNGDGVGDILVTDCGGAGGAGLTFVVFGSFDSGGMDLNDPAQLEDAGRGFRIVGARPNSPSHVGDKACHAAGAGDVNGDGLGDVVVGASYAGELHRNAAGRAYLIFGKPTTESVSLAAFDQGLQGDQGFRMDGAGYRDLAGRTVAGLGDVNGDGLSDVAVGAPFADSVYVVFGKSDPAPIDFTTFHLGTAVGGFRIRTPPVNLDLLLNVGGGGDVNGDGLADVVVGYSETERSYPGAAFVVFGKSDPLSVDARRLDGSGFEIRGPSRYSGAGSSVAIVGDVNRDGLDDVAVGVPGARHYRNVDGELKLTNQGAVFVVFGKKGTAKVYLAKVGDRGYEIRGPRSEFSYGTGVGEAVAAGGDVDGDGRDDVLIGASRTSYNGRLVSGSVYVVFGNGSTRVVKLDSLAQRGYRIDGPRREALIGGSVAGPGDVIGDERPDILIGGPRRFPTAFVVGGRR